MAKKSTSKKKIVISKAAWAWKADSEDIFYSLERALEPFGIYVQQSISCRGPDSFGFILSNQEISEDEAYDWEQDDEDDEDDDDAEDDDD